MASVALTSSGVDWLTLRIGPWQRTPARQGLMDRLVERDGADCAWCSCPVDPLSDQASFDHVQLASRGGSYELENLLLTCLDCNRARGDMEVERWLEHCLATRHVRYPIVAAAMARCEGRPVRL